MEKIPFIHLGNHLDGARGTFIVSLIWTEKKFIPLLTRPKILFSSQLVTVISKTETVCKVIIYSED